MNIQEREITDRLKIMGTYYDLDSLLGEKTDNQAVAKYYRKSDFFYNFIHARGSHSIHLGLSEDGFYHKEDFLNQAKYVESLLTEPSMKILEVGAGRLINTRYLAKRCPQHQFTALDIPNRNFLKNRVPKNVKLVEGDYNDLSVFPEQSFDIVFGVETICYAESKEKVIGEIAKVLKPGGKVVIFDGYEPKAQEAMSDFEKHAAAVKWAAMRVTSKDHYIGNTRKYLEEHQFTDIEITDITKQVVPTLRRLDRISGYYFMHPGMIKRMRNKISQDVTMNSIAGWLMLLTYDGENIHQYCRVVATKR